MDAVTPFAQRPPLPAELRPPVIVVLAVAAGLIAGGLLGAFAGGSASHRLVRGTFFASGFMYLSVSLLDFWEHFRLEKAATGRYFAATVVPLGESLNHALTTFVIVAELTLARPLPLRLEPRDWLVVSAPALFLALGWRDELVYHRRRSAHREDIMHTTAHLAAGVMMCSLLIGALFPR